MSELLKKSLTRDLMRFLDGEKIAVLIHFFLLFPDMQDEYMDEKFEIELIEKYENSISDTEKYLKKTSSYHGKIKELEAQLADILRELEEAEKIYEPEPLY